MLQNVGQKGDHPRAYGPQGGEDEAKISIGHITAPSALSMYFYIAYVSNW